jgi:hypothetical protein
MESVYGMYGEDEDFVALQEQVARELVGHFYRANRPELFFPYLRSALDRGYTSVESLLFGAYRDQWHPELLSGETELSACLLRALYRKCFGGEWDPEDLLREKSGTKRTPPPAADSNQPRVGEITFGGHRAYFRKSESEERTVELILDGNLLERYDVYHSYGDVYTLFLAYDPACDGLIVLYADFDHYGPETLTSGTLYRSKNGEITAYPFASDWVRGLKALPYSPYSFRIE